MHAPVHRTRRKKPCSHNKKASGVAITPEAFITGEAPSVPAADGELEGEQEFCLIVFLHGIRIPLVTQP